MAANRTFGMPYMGSKSSIAEWLIGQLPTAEVFVDLFAGGCAVTHTAILSGKYKRVIVNDITDSALVFRRAIEGGFKNEKRWISHEDFERLKDTDPYVRFCFSYGNNLRDYCYSTRIEPFKRAFHYAVIFRDLSEFEKLGIKIPKYVIQSNDKRQRRLQVKNFIQWQVKHGEINVFREYRKIDVINNLEALERLQSLERLERLEALKRLERLERLEALKRLERLERLEALKRLEALERLECTQGDYRDVKIPDHAVIYCDPPYKGTSKYLHEFDHEAFYSWCLEQTQPIFISEYDMPRDRFVRYAACGKRSLLAGGTNKMKIESLWIPKRR